jgi:hypothetical protein
MWQLACAAWTVTALTSCQYRAISDQEHSIIVFAISVWQVARILTGLRGEILYFRQAPNDSLDITNKLYNLNDSDFYLCLKDYSILIWITFISFVYTATRSSPCFRPFWPVSLQLSSLVYSFIFWVNFLSVWFFALLNEENPFLCATPVFWSTQIISFVHSDCLPSLCALRIFGCPSLDSHLAYCGCISIAKLSLQMRRLLKSKQSNQIKANIPTVLHSSKCVRIFLSTSRQMTT